MARPFAHHVPLQCISQRLHHVPSRQLVITSSSPSTGGVAHPPPMDGNDSDSPSNNPMLEPVLQASRSFNYAHRQVTRSLSNFETRLGSLLSAHTETQEATQEGNEWMLDTREYEFSRKQESVFRILEKCMHKCSNVLLLLAATDVIMGYIGYRGDAELLDLYASLADAFHELVTAVMVRYGSRSFRAVFETRGQDIHNLMGGLVNLSNVILEVAVISAWLAVVQVATATAVWPWTLAVCAGASVLATILRIATWGRPAYAQALTSTVLHIAESLKASVQWVFHLGGLLRRNVGQPMRRAKRKIKHKLGGNGTSMDVDTAVVMSSSGGSLDDSTRRPMQATSRRAQYEFSKEQEQVFRGVLAALRICSLAKWAQGLSEMVLVLSHVATKQWSQAVAGVFDTLDALVVAGLLMIVMRSFEGIIKTSGHDISLLLDALGPKLGIAKLFAEFADVALFLALAQIGQGVVAMVYTHYSSGVALPGSIEATVGLVAVGLGIIQQLM